SRANESDPDAVAARNRLSRTVAQWTFLRQVRVIQQNTERLPLTRLPGHDSICVGSVVDSEPMRRQARQLQPATRDELQKRLKVSLLRPTNVSGWQVSTALLVFAVVTSRTVRARQPQLELLSV